ncbi:MAG: PspC protein [Alphaproteobacteria bacterium]|nr:PspC protein [Alphaproteobacteria bacterium]
MKRGRKFTLDRANGKLMGVCAGIAEATGWDATLIRVGFVVATIAGGFPWTLLAYAVLAWAGKPKAADRFDGLGMAVPKRSAFEARRSMTDLDRRLAEVETYVTSQNVSLAREIESLR